MLEKILHIAEHFPGYKILAIASKEISLIKTQKIALALILLYPLIVILTLGTAYSGSTALSKIDVAIYVPAEISGFETQKLVDKLGKSQSINLVPTEDEAQVREMVRNRKAKAGIIVREPEPTQGRFVVDVVNDNSNLVSSVFFFQAASDSIRSVGFQTSQELLSEIWAGLGDIKKKLGDESRRIKDFGTQLDEVESQIGDLNRTVNSIDIEEMRGKLQGQREMVDELEPKISAFQEKINSFTALKQKNSDRISEAKTSMARYQGILKKIDSQIKETKQYCTSEKYTKAVQSNPEIKDLCDQIIISFNDVEKMVDDFNSLQTSFNEAEAEFDTIAADLNAASRELQAIKGRFSEAHSDLNYFNEQLSSLGGTVDRVNGLISSAMATKNRIKSDLDQADKLMGTFITNIDQLSTLSPQFLSNPVIINRNSLYKASKLEIMTPIALVLVIMLTAILLTGVSFVVERTEGAYSRLVLSSTSKFELFLGKVLGQLAFSLFEAGVIMSIAILFFGVRVSGVSITVLDMINAITGKAALAQVFMPVLSIKFALGLLNIVAATAIIGFAFISLGLFISNYTKIQSTTILAGLLAVIPMIFVSGIIIPMEFMSELVQQASTIQPLSLGVVIATEAIIKGTMITQLLPEVAKLAVPSVIFVLFTLFNKNL